MRVSAGVVIRDAGFAGILLVLASALLPAQSVTVSPTSLSFGNQAISTASSAKTVTVKNGQTVALTVSSITASGDYSQTNTCGTSLAAGAKCTVSVTFAPSALGARTGTLTITDSANNSPQSASLTGTGIVQAALSPATESFGNQAVRTASATKIATLTNNLGTPLTISSIAVSGDYSQTNTCGTSVAAGAICSINVTFSPTTTGSRTGILTVTDSASNSPQTVSLTGSGILQATVSPGSLSFGNQAVGTASATKIATLTNNLGTPLTISSITTSGDYSQTNTCGASVASGATCTVSVMFTPTTTGTRPGTLTVTDSAINSPQTVSLSGNGVVPVTVSPSTLAFGNQAVTTTSGAKTVTVSNKQPTAVTITSITTPTVYAQTNTCGTLLAAQGTCTVSVTFSPTATGSQPGTLTITDNASNSPQTVNLTGTGTALPTITKLSVTSGLVGTSVTITGTGFGGSQGNSTVTFNGAAATPTSWKSTSIAATVPAGATTGNVVVMVNGGPSSGVAFTVLPNISNLSTASGIAGTPVTITGSGFGNSQGSGTVTFSGVAATTTSWSSTSITALVPIGATGGSGTVVVTVGSVASNTAPFTVVPNIAGLSATSGAIGSVITITGTGFGSNQGASAVTFNNTSAASTNWAAGSITVAVPIGARTGNVVATVGGTASSGVAFTVLSGGFIATTGQMESSRYGQTATQLTSGQVLIAGGMSSSGAVNSAELYTASNQTFAAANAMNVARWLHTATLLNDGTVLIAGGSSVSSETTLNSAEIYNPVAGTFTLLSSTLNTPRVGHTATLLSNGQVLIVGGYDPTTGIIADSELYDPTVQVFVDLGNTNTPRFHHAATLLQDGQVLITGGETDPTPSGAYNNAELFNPTTWTFSSLSASMVSGREGHAASLLNDGTVLISGGDLPGAGSLNTAEVFNPTTSTFTAISSVMTNPRIYHDAVLLNGGKVLLSGGENDSGGSSTALNTAELYDPIAQQFTAVAGNMTSVREHQTATLLNDGTILEDGGTDGTHAFNTAEIYTTSKLMGLTSITISPAAPSVPLGAQQLLVATGTFNGGGTQVLSSGVWSSSSTSVSAVSNDASDTGFAATLAQGSATITVSAAGVTGSTTITVPAPTLVSITLSPQTLAMPLGTSQQFTATGTYSDGSVQDLTSTATWTSSSSPATVSTAGLVTAVSLGNSTIQASSGPQSSSTTVTVGPPVLVILALTPPTASISVGTTQQYQVIGTYTDGSTQNLTTSVSWSSVPLSTASVSTAGLATGVGKGAAIVTVTSGTFDSVATLSVGAPSLVSIGVVPNATSIPIGSKQQFIATGNYTDQSTQDITSSVAWASSNQSAVSLTASGLASALAGGNSTITATSGSVSGTAVLTVETASTGLNTSRFQHSATLLNNGTVLIAGGVNCPSSGSCTYLNSAELYNPNSGTVAITGSMSAPRSAPAVLLSNGKVLIAGGYSCDSGGNCTSLKSAEVYDPVAGTFSIAGNMTVDRYEHTMTLLNSGQVLIAGGETCSSATSCSALNAAEIYDPVAGTFTATGNLNAARFGASAVALRSGLVLIAGGFDGANYPASGELYDPIASTFSNTPTNLNTPRAKATATLLDNGQVLIAGGSTCNLPGCPSSVAELYNNGSFYYFSYPTSNMNVTRWDQTATLLTNGEVLLAGGFDSCPSSCVSDGTTELFNPQGSAFASGQALSTGRSGHTATLLTDGSVLLVGGINNGVTLSSTDSYQPSSLALPPLASITISPSNQPMVLGTTLPLIATGTDAYSDNLGPLPSVIWNSSSPAVATISNAPGSAGIVNSVSVGTTTITASIGAISASTQVIVTAPLVSISLSPSNPSITTNSPQELQFTAIGVYSDGSSRDLTADVTWGTSNASVALVIPNPAVPGIVAPVAVGAANITASFGTISGSTSVTVTVPSVPVAPTVATVSPTSGVAGTQVTLTGSGFGSSQGNGIVLLGSTLGTVVTWSNTQVVATVNTGSVSGVAEVQQGGLASNSMPFTVNTASITSVSPATGLPGTQVTITGSGFGASQGSGIVWLGTVAGVVSSWSDGLVVATVASGSTSGNAQILQNGVWSNAVTFTIDSLHISGVTPNSGSAGTVVVITGGGFGSTQGSGSVLIGGTPASVVGWSDSQVMASVASSAVTGVVRVEQNGTWSNAVTFTVPPSLSGGTSVFLAPNFMSMVVGDTRSIQALDPTGQSVTGLTWTSSDTTVATLSTDDPPMITAVAPGSITLSAGSASASLDVFLGPTLPTGTKIWSNSGDGTPVISIVPAVPSSTGVADIFALQQSGNVQAIKADGTVGWTTSVGLNNTLLPDFQGGLVVANQNSSPASVQKLDGMTGQAYPAYNFSNPNGPPPTLVHTDGTIFTVDNNAIVGINPTTGQPKFPPVPLEQGVYTNDGDCGEFSPIDRATLSTVGQPIIAGDGYAYFPYFWTVDKIVYGCKNMPIGHSEGHSRIMRVGTDGSALEIKVADWAVDSTNGASTGSAPAGPVLGNLITNADQGVLYSWGGCSGQYPNNGSCTPQFQLKTISEDGNASTVMTSMGNGNLAVGGGSVNPIQPVLQRADGSYIGTVATSTGSSMVAFTASGQQLWTQPNYAPQIATSGGGVIATSLATNQVTTFDTNGSQTGQLASLPTQSWKGSYQLGSVESFSALLLALESNSYAAAPGGSFTGVGTAAKLPSIGLFWCGSGSRFNGTCENGRNNFPDHTDLGFTYVPRGLVTSNLVPMNVTPYDFTATAPNWEDLIQTNALAALKAAFLHFPVQVRIASTHSDQATHQLVIEQDHVVFVVGDPTGTNHLGGGTAGGSTTTSYDYYFPQMLYAQTLPGSTLPVMTSANATAPRYQNLMIAIGKSLGNTAAHELGHQFALAHMDCDEPSGSPCPGSGPHGDLYEYWTSAASQFSDIGPPLQWTSDNASALTKELLTGEQ